MGQIIGIAGKDQRLEARFNAAPEKTLQEHYLQEAIKGKTPMKGRFAIV